jgi:phage replication-related protein YjqB (UPF0714/DUF867 family)
MATFEGTVRRSFQTQTTLDKHAEHCSLDPQRLAAIGLEVRSQIRVKRGPDQVALYTVSETRDEQNESTLRMAKIARQRLEPTEQVPDEFDAVVDTQVPHPTYSDEDAEKCSEFVERLDDNGAQKGLVVLAPHGGAIERFTDLQAERVAGLLGTARASVWRCRGFRSGGGALRAWHITAAEISDLSFPRLRSIARRGFTHAVAFHGFDRPGVIVGGAAPAPLKEEIVCAIADALEGSEIEVRLAQPSDNLDGNEPSNIVNRLTAGGGNGVQIEQSIDAREGFWKAIACAVALAYSRKLP